MSPPHAWAWGLIQAPRYRVVSELASGALVEVLADFPPSPLPVHVLYSHTRRLSPRLRVHRLDG
jgi:DNA-binding transcriptional LysR family regulator